MKKSVLRSILNKLIILLFIIMLFGCKVQQQASTLYNNAHDFREQLDKGLLINFDGELLLDKNQKIFGSIKILNDSTFQLFINSTTLGIELARILFYGDSVFLINRFSKQYYKGNMARFTNYLCNVNDSKIVLNALLGNFEFKSEEHNHRFDCKTNSVVFNYKIYNKKHLIYTNINIVAKQASNDIELNLRYKNIKKQKITLKEFNVSKSFTEIP